MAWRTADFDELGFAYRPFSYRLFAIPDSLRRTLACGITTVRDAGGADLGLKQAVDDGLVEGPRLQISVTMLSQTAGPRRLHAAQRRARRLRRPVPRHALAGVRRRRRRRA